MHINKLEKRQLKSGGKNIFKNVGLNSNSIEGLILLDI